MIFTMFCLSFLSKTSSKCLLLLLVTFSDRPLSSIFTLQNIDIWFLMMLDSYMKLIAFLIMRSVQQQCGPHRLTHVTCDPERFGEVSESKTVAEKGSETENVFVLTFCTQKVCVQLLIQTFKVTFVFHHINPNMKYKQMMWLRIENIKTKTRCKRTVYRLWEMNNVLLKRSNVWFFLSRECELTVPPPSPAPSTAPTQTQGPASMC